MPDLRPGPRAHALADLEQTILKAELNRDRLRSAVERLKGDRKNFRPAQGILRIAEERLEQLYRSRQVLIGGEGPEDEEPGEPAA